MRGVQETANDPMCPEGWDERGEENVSGKGQGSVVEHSVAVSE